MIFNNFLLFLYRFLSCCLIPVYGGLLYFRCRKGKEDPSRLLERWGIPSRKKPPGFCIWMHGASVGESMGALGLIQFFQNDPRFSGKKYYFLVTSGTKSSATILKNRLPHGAIHQMLPIDVPHAVKKFFDFWNPALGVIIESDLWPNLLFAAEKKNIPLAIVNGRISEKSFRLWRWGRPLIRPLLKKIFFCSVNTPQQGKRLEYLGVPQTHIGGNLKFSIPPLPEHPPALTQLTRQIGNRPVWIAASTHPGEEEILLKVHQKLQEKHPQILLILIPRHPERAPTILNLIQKQQTKIAVRSKKEPITPKISVYLADTFGELGVFYRLKAPVFMGGSFVPVGGHNLIEAAQLSRPLLHGPYMENNTDIAAIFHKAKGAITVQNAQDLYDHLNRLLHHVEEQKQLGQLAFDAVQSQKKSLNIGLNPLLEKII